MAETRKFQRRSGRVVSLGRLMLATLFLAAVFMDASQPAQAIAATYVLLIVYVMLALAIAVATWDNWWLDATLAAPAHVLDVAIFTILVLSTQGYTSPFFLLFVFLLLSAAIRWGWRETAATAAIVIILYLTAGMIAAQGAGFELQRFFVRSGQLIILSALMIWFGANQGVSAAPLMKEDFDPATTLDESPFETALRHAIRVTGSHTGLLVWRPNQGDALAISIKKGQLAGETPPAEGAFSLVHDKPLLFDLPRRRALSLKRKAATTFTKEKRFPRSVLNVVKASLSRSAPTPVRAKSISRTSAACPPTSSSWRHISRHNAKHLSSVMRFCAQSMKALKRGRGWFSPAISMTASSNS